MIRCCFFSLLFILFAGSSLSQGFLKTEGKEIVDGQGDPILLRAMGLGGWMIQEGYMLNTADFASAQFEIKAKIEELIGKEAMEEFYDLWHANHCRKIDVDSMSAWGFNAVRLPMHYNLFTLPIEEEPVTGQNTWIEKGFVMTDSLLSWCAANEMYLILDLHAAPGGQGYDKGISDYDETKPSLWELKANRDKAVALWGRLAERYKDSEWIAGYDLLNEPNWDLPGGTLLRSFYEEVTEAIRAVDNNHIIFIEGNWFANDFTGLTPPWDDNMVYSPHKYWSFNTENDLDWILPMRETYNVPLYFGESGENSNVWFRDAINLFESNNIGWAWWPLKKFQSISCPLSVNQSFGWQALLNYWRGNGAKPTAENAKTWLFQMADNLKLEKCIYRKDVTDAMFRQVRSAESKPYTQHTVPGVIQSIDYDLGRDGVAYKDAQVATYHISNGSFTAWNNGWFYRNDGVDIDISQDGQNSNEYCVAWTEEGEWLQYETEVLEDGIYNIEMRTATGDFGGRFHWAVDSTDLSISYFVPFSGDYQSWQTTLVENVPLKKGTRKLRLYIDGTGFNLGNMTFTRQGSLTDIPASYVTSSTVNANRIRVNINKEIDRSSNYTEDDFAVLVNGEIVTVTDVTVGQDGYHFLLDLDYDMDFTQTIKVSYFGTGVSALDGTLLEGFALKDVTNNLPEYFLIPGKIEAEDFYNQNGIQLEATTDDGGGENVGYLDVDDYIDYDVFVTEAGLYNVSFRTASESAGGGLKVQLINDQGVVSDRQTFEFPSTGGWQSWETTTGELILPEGRTTLRLLITEALFNINWMSFDFLTSSDQITDFPLTLSPNPTASIINIIGDVNIDMDALQVYDMNGRLCQDYSVVSRDQIDVSNLTNGVYTLLIKSKERSVIKKFVKI